MVGVPGAGPKNNPGDGEATVRSIRILEFQTWKGLRDQVAVSSDRKEELVCEEEMGQKRRRQKPGRQGLDATERRQQLLTELSHRPLFPVSPQGDVLSSCFLKTSVHSTCLGDILSWSESAPLPSPPLLP